MKLSIESSLSLGENFNIVLALCDVIDLLLYSKLKFCLI